MFIVLLRFSANRGQAGEYLEAHKTWIDRGLGDGVFLLVGSLEGGSGGAILAQDTSPASLQTRVNADPFVVEDVVRPDILEIIPSEADERLRFLLETSGK